MPIIKYRTKEGIRYRARFKFQNKIHDRRGFKRKQEAKDWITDERRRLQEEARLQPTAGTFSGLSTAYLDDHDGRFTDNTLRQKAFVFRNFIAHHDQDTPIDSLTRDHIKDYLRAQRDERGPTSAYRDHRDLHALFRWGQTEGKVSSNPARHIEKFPEASKPRYVPPARDVAAVLMRANREQQDL